MIGSLASSDCRFGGDFYADLYRITGTKNQPLEITVSAEFPVYIGGELAAGGEGTWIQGGRTMTLAYTPSADGTVNIWVSSEAEKVSGGYTLSAKCAGPAACRSRAVRK